MIAFTLFGCGMAMLVYCITVKIIDYYNKIYPFIHKYRFYWEDGYDITSALTYIIDDLEISPTTFNKRYDYDIVQADDETFTIKLIRRDFT